MNLEQELRGWSDVVLTMLHQEENCSDEFRRAALIELCSRSTTLVKLTSEMLHSTGTNGYQGWSKAQLAVLGVPWPAPNGWLIDLVGTTIPYWKWKKFCDLKGKKSQK